MSSSLPPGDPSLDDSSPGDSALSDSLSDQAPPDSADQEALEAAEEQVVSPWEAALPRFSLGRPVTVLVLGLTTLVLGLIATLGIPLEMLPQGFTAPFLTVVVPWSDATPQEVLDKVVIPLEDELATVSGLERFSSMSNNSNGLLFLNFKQNTDMDVAYREVRDRVQRVRPRLPSDVDKVFIRKHDISGFPVYGLGVAIDPGLADAYDLLQNEMVLPMERVDGVASVEAHGLEEREILIEIDRQKAEASGLNIYQLSQDLAGDNFTMASGHVRSGGSKMLLRSVARYEDLATLENRLVAPSIRLRDVARIRYEEPEKEYSVRVNGQRAVALMAMKEGQANTLEVCQRLQAVVDGFEANPRLAHIEMVPIFDQGKIILSSLGTMYNSGRIGALFALMVLFFFLRRLRMTLIITLSIPLSLLMALTVMYFTGETLNILTLLGLMICVGLLVDNSVVVAENIHRLHRLGLDRRTAAVQGAGEISLAVVMATLTTIAVFLPISLIKGNAQFFLQRLSIPISVSLAASLLVALIFIPLAAYLTLPRERANGAPEPPPGRGAALDRLLRRGYEASLGRLNHGYNVVLAIFLRRRLDLVMLLLIALAGTWYFSFQNIDLAAQQEREQSGFEVDARLPSTYTLADAEGYFRGVEAVLEEHEEEWDLQGYFIEHGRTRGEVQGWFKSPRTNRLTGREATEQLTEALPEVPGVKLFTGEQSRVSECEEDGVYCVQLYGDDAVEVSRLREELEDLFRAVPGVVGVQNSGDENPQELALVVDRERAQKQGINPQVVAGVVSYALRGQTLPKFSADGREIPVRVRFQEENRESLAELADFAVPTPGGGTVPLNAVTDPLFLEAPTGIFRRDRRISRTITLELEEGKKEQKAAGERIEALMGRIDLPEGMSFASTKASATDEDILALGLAAGLSVVFIYLLMSFLFESFVLPLSIILTIPLASIGVGWGHTLSGLNLDFLGGVGAVLLIGVVVNNGIVLIDYVNRLRQQGMRRTEALLAAAERRFRPIMMTALTTICATIPLTLGEPTEIGLSYTSFGVTLIGGMTTATFLTLLVVPVFYTLFDDARLIATAATRWILDPRQPPADSAELG